MFMLFLLFALAVLVILIAIVIEIKNYKEYKESEYYKITKIPYWKIHFDTGVFGEYDTYRCLCPLDGYKRYLFNCYVSTGKMPKSIINKIYERLYPLTQVGELEKMEHIETIKKRYEKPVLSKTTTETQDKKCPRCGGKLVLKVAKRGNYAGSKFYGCANYPGCKYIENVK